MCRTYIDTKTIIVNLLKEDKHNSVSVERLKNLVVYIYQELSVKHKLNDYQIAFDISVYSIERTVDYNNDIFELDITGENIRLRKHKSADALAEKYQVDEIIISIIKNFHNSQAT